MTGIASTLPAQYTINGLVITSNKVMDNLIKIATASGCYITYDIHQSKWAVIIDQAATSQWSFNSSNLVDAVTVSSTGIDGMYNAVKVTYPHLALMGMNDFTETILPTTSWYPNESLNELNLNYGLVNNQVQADLLSKLTLAQSRIDRIVTFQSDYSMINCRAGDIIDITLPQYGWTAKLFRVLTITEDDPDTGEIKLSFTAQEYDPAIYATAQSALKMMQRSAVNSISTANTVTAGNLAVQTAATLSSAVPGVKSSIDASYVVISWTSYDGSDLDIRFRCAQAGQTTFAQTLGFTTNNGSSPTPYWYNWPQTGTPVFTWGGDNTGALSVEAILIDVAAFKSAYPSATIMHCECRGNWYLVKGTLPVKLQGVMYTGGTISHAGYNFTNSGATATANIVGESITLQSSTAAGTTPPSGTAAGATTDGDLLGWFHFDTVKKQGWFSLSATG